MLTSDDMHCITENVTSWIASRHRYDNKLRNMNGTRNGEKNDYLEIWCKHACKYRSSFPYYWLDSKYIWYRCVYTSRRIWTDKCYLANSQVLNMTSVSSPSDQGLYRTVRISQTSAMLISPFSSRTSVLGVWVPLLAADIGTVHGHVCDDTVIPCAMSGLFHKPKTCWWRYRRSCIGPSPGWTRELLPQGKFFFIQRAEVHFGVWRYYHELWRKRRIVCVSRFFNYIWPYDERTRTGSGIDRNKVTFAAWRYSHTNLLYAGNQKRARFSDGRISRTSVQRRGTELSYSVRSWETHHANSVFGWNHFGVDTEVRAGREVRWFGAKPYCETSFSLWLMVGSLVSFLLLLTFIFRLYCAPMASLIVLLSIR